MSKLNYSSRSNQSCNRHVNMLKYIDLAELQRSLGNSRCRCNFSFILVTLVTNFGLIGVGKRYKIHGEIKQVTRSTPIHTPLPSPPQQHTQNKSILNAFLSLFGQRSQRGRSAVEHRLGSGPKGDKVL